MKIKFVIVFIALVLTARHGLSQQPVPAGAPSIPLHTGWEFLRQDLAGVWEAVRPSETGDAASVPIWQPVTIPHCFNASDAVDPDGNYYRGPAWYRTRLSIANPYAAGRTLLHFEGAGQKTDVYVYTTRVGSHTGGYDEWSYTVYFQVGLKHIYMFVFWYFWATTILPPRSGVVLRDRGG